MKHPEDIQSRAVLSSEKTKAAHAFIRAIGGLTRFRIIVLLRQNPAGLNVTHLARLLDASPSQISHQVNILKKYDIVRGTSTGRNVTYRIHSILVEKFLRPLG